MKNTNKSVLMFLERPTSLLPEYAMPYLIYLLSHLPNCDYTKSEHLSEIKE
jgi:hypothetical protein